MTELVQDIKNKFTGASTDVEYPAKQFLEGFAGPSGAILSEVDEHNKPGARPGKQSTLKEVRLPEALSL